MTLNKTETELMGNAAISKWALGCFAVWAVFGVALGCWRWLCVYGVLGVCGARVWTWCAARCEWGSVAVYLLAAVREVTLWWMVQSNQGWAVTGCTHSLLPAKQPNHTHSYAHTCTHAYTYTYINECVSVSTHKSYCIWTCTNTTSCKYSPATRWTTSSNSLHPFLLQLSPPHLKVFLYNSLASQTPLP